MEEDKKVLDEVLRDNSFLVFDNIEGANITKENKYTDGKSRFINKLILSARAFKSLLFS